MIDRKKQWLLTAIAMVLCTSAAAGGPDKISAVKPTGAGVYVQANVGYAARGWSNTSGSPYTGAVITGQSRDEGGFAYGADLGFQANHYFSFELGWFGLPQVKSSVNPNFSAANGNVESWFAYGAVKGAFDVYTQTQLYGKVGAAYNENAASSSVLAADGVGVTSKSNYWSPLFAVGAQYYFIPAVSISVQYTFVSGYSGNAGDEFITPNINIGTVSIGYKFMT